MFTRAHEAAREPVSVTNLLTEVETLLNGRLPAHTNLAVRRKPAFSLLANSAQLVQVFLNLAINASDSLGGRFGIVSIDAEKVFFGADDRLPFARGFSKARGAGTIFFATGQLQPDVTYVRFIFRDTGCGIPQELIPKIFDPFFTTKEYRSGSGLGLAVVRGIVAAHDGVITVLSTEDVGTTFQIYLPAREVQEAQPESASDLQIQKERRALAGRERILIVDDDVDVADGLSLNLTRLGYETAPVYSPREALEIFKEDPSAWDIVISDQVMPGLKGLDLLIEMRNIRPDLRSILCSGFSANLTDEVIHAAGIDTYLTKPASTTAVAAAIRRLMRLTYKRPLTPA
jgi:CheY-like chemotaxis protein